jgi:S1-C subfamily serine protease
MEMNMYPEDDPRPEEHSPASPPHEDDAPPGPADPLTDLPRVDAPSPNSFEVSQPVWSEGPPRHEFGARPLAPPVRDILPPTVEWPAGPVSPPDPVVGGQAQPETPASKSTDRPRGRVLIPLVSGFLGAVLALAAVAGVGGLNLSDESTTTTSTTIVEQASNAVAPPTGGTTTLQLREANVDAVLVGEVVIPSTVSVQVGQEGPTGFSRRGSGSGVVFDTEGHIITNDHVASGAPAYRVVFADGRAYQATLVGTDPVTDLAVLKIDADNLVPIEFGSSDDLSVGDPTVAVGNPLGLDGGPSLTVGVLSAFDRLVQTSGSETLYGMLQTDAPITQGSSGGALVDETGRLIGITTAVGVSEIGVEGIGFATPVEIVERVVEELIANGEAGTAFLGITGGTTFDTAADGALVPAGVEIGSIDPNGAAVVAGLQAGDLIVSFEGQEIEVMQDLIILLRRSHVGDTVELMIERDGNVETINVVLGEG